MPISAKDRILFQNNCNGTENSLHPLPHWNRLLHFPAHGIVTIDMGSLASSLFEPIPFPSLRRVPMLGIFNTEGCPISCGHLINCRIEVIVRPPVRKIVAECQVTATERRIPCICCCFGRDRRVVRHLAHHNSIRTLPPLFQQLNKPSQILMHPSLR